MFKLVSDRRAWWPVTFPGVTEHGNVVENKIEMRFTLHGEDEFFALFREASSIAHLEDAMKVDAVVAPPMAPEEAGAEEPAATEPAATSKLSDAYAAFVEKIATDWRGVAAENGEPIRWSHENLALLMNVPGVFKATIAALIECRNGQPKARAGN